MIDRDRRDKVPYTWWVRDGYVIATPGNVIDYNVIENQILNDSQKFSIRQIAYDRYNATQIVTNLQNTGSLELVPFAQNITSMSAPSKDFEKRILSAELNHGNNPVMKWMVSCTEAYTDSNGNIKPVKPDRRRTGKRIDGVIASIMALDRAVQADVYVSAYESRGVLVI